MGGNPVRVDRRRGGGEGREVKGRGAAPPLPTLLLDQVEHIQTEIQRSVG